MNTTVIHQDNEDGETADVADEELMAEDHDWRELGLSGVSTARGLHGAFEHIHREIGFEQGVSAYESEIPVFAEAETHAPPPGPEIGHAAHHPASSLRSSGYARGNHPAEESPSSTERLLANKYRVERIVGQSRIAVIAQVRHVELRQRFLLLYLHPEARSHLDSVERFLHGARMAQQLRGEHVLHARDAGRLVNGVPYVAIEYPEGSSLRHVLQIAGPLTVADAVDYALQVALALAEAHGIGMYHGSLSSAQLYVTRRPDGFPLVKVLGFGVSDALGPFALDDDVEFDPRRAQDLLDFPEALASVAPEQLRNAGGLDATSDVWSLGAVLHELLAGAPVFQAANAAALVATIAADAPTPMTAIRSDVPAGLEALILRCLEKNKSGRFPSVADLAAALAAFAPAHARGHVERIVRTQALSTRTPGSGRISAIVHVGPAPAPVTPAAKPVEVPRPVEAGPSKASFAVLSAAGVFALAGAGMLGAGLAVRANLTSVPAVMAAAPLSPVTAAAALIAPPAPTTAPPVQAVPTASATAPATSAATLAAPLPPPPVPRTWAKPVSVAVAKKPPAAKPKSDGKQSAEDLFDDTK